MHDYWKNHSFEYTVKDYRSGLLFPSPEDFPNPGIEPRSPALQVNSLLSEPPGEALPALGKDLKLRVKREVRSLG